MPRPSSTPAFPLIPESQASASADVIQAAAPALANRNAFPGQSAQAPASPLLGSLNLTPAGLSGEQFQTEISATVTVGGKLFVFSSGGGSSLQVTNATNPSALSLVGRVEYGGGYVSQSVATFGNLVAVALSPANYGTSGGEGLVRFYRLGTDGSLTKITDVTVGYLPDGLAFNAQGTKLVVANEGEPAAGYTLDRPGSIGIIDIQGRAGQERFSYSGLDFAGITLPSGIRLSGPAGTTQANDIEPEYVTVLGNYAYVTLQENNGVAKVNLATNTIEKVFALGTVDYSTQLVDLSDKDGGFKPKLGQNFEGLRMADGIAAYSVKGKDYFITANEGDGRDYTGYKDESGNGPDPNVRTLTDDARVGTDLATTFGGRSISIFDANTGTLLWDSGNTLQTVAFAAGMYADGRSDSKGVEPEGVIVVQINGRSYAIVSLERTSSSMLAVFDVTDPTAGQFVTSTVIDGSISPEGLKVVEAKQSPTGRQQLVVSNEISNTLNVFDLEALIAAPPVAGAGTFASTMLKDVAGGPELEVTNLITNGEFTNGLNPGYSVYAPTGIFDGLGAYDNGDGTFTVLANSELGNTVGYGYLVDGVALTGARISKFIIDKDVDDDASNGYQSAMVSGGIAYKEIIDAEGNAVTSAAQLNGGFARFCSSSYEQADRFGAGRGFVDSIFLTGEESDEGLLYALDTETEVIYALAGLGRAGWETAIQVDTGSINTVGVLLMDDNTAPIYLWVGEKSTADGASFLERNGLAAGQGNLYTWVPTAGSIGTAAGTAGVPDSADLNALALGTAAAGSWVLVGTGAQVALLSEAQLRTTANGLGALQLSRLEDASINPTDGQQVVFATTGNADFGAADTFGNLITLDLSGAFDGNGLIAGGNSTGLAVIYDGDRQIAAWDEAFGDDNGQIDIAERAAFGATIIRNPDNLTWSADGSIYVQEDRSVDKAFFAEQEASIWQVSATTTDPLTGQATAERWMQIDRNAVPTAYGQTDPRAAGGTNPDPGNWESSGIIDVSYIYGLTAGSLFLADVQAHSLVNGNIAGNGYLAQGGQLNLIQTSDLF
ncbi:choice-of-anchor I family protein [Vulcanococcus limneticus]|uniref:choice-of-anchor I family protein n=1 Tax=Vulcanococcus limneticus TaxID=2170428 RepID=UPI00398BDCBA